MPPTQTDGGGFFANPDAYLGNVDLRIRRRVVAELLRNPAGRAILDIGCGDGSLSAQFLGHGNRVTFVDRSAGMLERARTLMGERPDARYREADLMSLDVPASERFDIVLCVGVLAHVADTAGALARLAAAVRPGGCVVIQYSDEARWAQLPARLWSAVRETIKPVYGYRLRGIRGSELRAKASAAGLRWVQERRYWATPPGLRRLVSRDLRHAFERFTLEHAALARHGQEVLDLFERE